MAVEGRGLGPEDRRHRNPTLSGTSPAAKRRRERAGSVPR